jgi:hypothetical protein
MRAAALSNDAITAGCLELLDLLSNADVLLGLVGADPGVTDDHRRAAARLSVVL